MDENKQNIRGVLDKFQELIKDKNIDEDVKTPIDRYHMKDDYDFYLWLLQQGCKPYKRQETIDRLKLQYGVRTVYDQVHNPRQRDSFNGVKDEKGRLVGVNDFDTPMHENKVPKKRVIPVNPNSPKPSNIEGSVKYCKNIKGESVVLYSKDFLEGKNNL